MERESLMRQEENQRSVVSGNLTEDSASMGR
jgi:hypothetical protein